MIKAENLTKIFGGKKALDSVNVTIGEGSIYGRVGSNGSGKSTLLRLASGVYMPDGGSITANGEKIFDNPQIKARIAYLGDTPYFMPNASIKETADFYRRLYPRFDNTLYNRLLEKSGGSFVFKKNKYSTYKDRVHFTPIWFPDRKNYTVYVKVFDVWCPAGQLSVRLTDQIFINGNVYDDWHIAPTKP